MDVEVLKNKLDSEYRLKRVSHFIKRKRFVKGSKNKVISQTKLAEKLEIPEQRISEMENLKSSALFVALGTILHLSIKDKIHPAHLVCDLLELPLEKTGITLKQSEIDLLDAFKRLPVSDSFNTY